MDTCTLIWLCAEPHRLSATAAAAIDAAETVLLFSDVSALEITTKWSAGKLSLPLPPRQWLEQQLRQWSITDLAMTREVIYRAAELPLHHRDPFDRLLVATALCQDAIVVTPDAAIQAYPVGWWW